MKPHAVLKITDVCFAENAATINAFEIVEDAGLTEEYASENTPPASKKLKTESGASAPAKRWQPIASLNPYHLSWTVKAKLASKGNVRTFRNAKGEGKVMTVEFVDEAGTAIQATMWKDAIDKYDQIMEVGKVYYVGKGSLRPANKKYSSVNNDYEMSLDGRSEIELCADAGDELARKMSRAYDLVKIDKLPLKIGGRASVDVVAIVTSVGELGSVRRKSDNAEIQRRDVVLVDDTNKTVTLTLWNALAVEQGAQLATMANPSSPCAVCASRTTTASRYPPSRAGAASSSPTPRISPRRARASRARTTPRPKPSRRAPVWPPRAAPAARGPPRSAAHGRCACSPSCCRLPPRPSGGGPGHGHRLPDQGDQPMYYARAPRRATTRRLSRRTASGTARRRRRRTTRAAAGTSCA